MEDEKKQRSQFMKLFLPNHSNDDIEESMDACTEINKFILDMCEKYDPEQVRGFLSCELDLWRFFKFPEQENYENDLKRSMVVANLIFSIHKSNNPNSTYLGKLKDYFSPKGKS